MEQRIIVDTIIIVFMNVPCFGKRCFVNLLFQFQILWGGRWQEGTACSTGEEVEQINAHMSRCGNTTKYMLPEGTVMFT